MSSVFTLIFFMQTILTDLKKTKFEKILKLVISIRLNKIINNHIYLYSYFANRHPLSQKGE